ncbi:MAG: DHH family phosphoesterase [Acidobacteriota bacterium]|nr:DHH family phosphoesterase [Acidobacteriota bacterium]
MDRQPLAKRLQDAGLRCLAADPRRADSYVKADVTSQTCVIIEDPGKRGLRRVLQAVQDAGATLIYVLGTPNLLHRSWNDELRLEFPDVTGLEFAELLSEPLLTQLSRSTTRAKVQQYQRYFADADRVLILLHNDPDPDAMASGLALRTVLRRTKTTAIIGALGGITRPENLRMAKLLDIQVERITPNAFNHFDRVATVDVQPHYFGNALPKVDLVIDHHPEQPGYTAIYKDIRADYGSTSTILTEHLRAVDMSISERTATAMLYAIKSDTLFFARHTNRLDLDAFTYLYPLADSAMIRKMEGAEITLERLEYVRRAMKHGALHNQVFTAFLGTSSREDFIVYLADFFLQLEDVKWTVVAGVVDDTLIVSVRNLGYTRNAGEFVRQSFADIGSAGGHRSMAKALLPLKNFREKFGNLDDAQVPQTLHQLIKTFLKD